MCSSDLRFCHRTARAIALIIVLSRVAAGAALPCVPSGNTITLPPPRFLKVMGRSTDITSSVGGGDYGIPFPVYAQRSIAVADDDASAVVVIGYDRASGKFGVFQTFEGLAASPTWNTLITPTTSVPYRGAYYVNRGLIYLIGESGALARLTYSAGAWSTVTATAAGAGSIRGLFGG